MAKPMRLRLDDIRGVALCPKGANPGAHITLFKHDTAAPAVAGGPSQRLVNKAVAAFPKQPIAEALTAYAKAHPAEYAHVTEQTGRGTDEPFTAPAAAAAPVFKRADATARLQKAAELLTGAGVAPADALPLAARMFPAVYEAHAGHVPVRKTGPTTDQLLAELAEYFRETRDRLRRGSDEKAALAATTQRRELVAALLNAIAAD